MEDSILLSTKKMLGMSQSYTAFDLDILTEINSVFSILAQMGVGPEEGFSISDDQSKWEDFVVPANQLQMVKTYIAMKTRLVFDPPATSFVIAALEKRIEEYEFRLNMFRERVVANEADALAALEVVVDPEEVVW